MTSDAFTESQFDYMVVEVNLLYRRDKRPTQEFRKKQTILFFCIYCQNNMVDKTELSWHQKMDVCDIYDLVKDGKVKIYPFYATKGKKAISEVFERHSMPLL